MEQKSLHDCPDCTCGKMKFEWADREPCIFPTVENIIKLIRYWAFDHFYDRGERLPLGIPNKWEEVLKPIVHKYMDLIHPDWKNKTVWIAEDDPLWLAFSKEMEEALKPIINEENN